MGEKKLFSPLTPKWVIWYHTCIKGEIRMKKLMIAFSILSAGALIAHTEVNGTPTTDPIDWFDVTTTTATGGEINIADGATWEPVEGKFEVDSDLEHLVTFEATDSLTQKMAKVSFTLDAATVPTDSLTDLVAGTARVAFAIHQVSEIENDRMFKAWTGTEWVSLTGADVPAEGTSFILLMEFDNRETTSSKVRFSVGPTEQNMTALTSGGNEWIPYSEAVTDTVSIGFAGSGKITSFKGNQLKVIAEIIPVGGGTITIKEEDLEKFKVPAGSTYTRDQFIAAQASAAFGDKFVTTGITVGEAYALGLVADDGTGTMAPVNGGVLKAKAIAQSGSSDGIKLDLDVNPPEGTGATITYNILRDNEEYKKDLNKDQLIIPTTGLGVGLKVFKVQAVVTPAPVVTK